MTEVEYCAYTVLQRSVVFSDSKSFTAEHFVGSLRDGVGVQMLNGQEN